MSGSRYLRNTITSTFKVTMLRGCKLEPVKSKNKSIELSPGKTIVGRSKQTGIEDVRCSKRQLELDTDIHNERIKLRVLGINPVGVNGLMVPQNKECELKNGDIIELIYGKHPYKVKFNGANSSEEDLTSASADKPSESTNDSESQEQTSKVAVEHWDSVENGKMVIFTTAGVRASEKIAGYDMDGTIIRTKSGNVFPKSIDDWQLNYGEVTKKLKALHENGYKICFFTNQAGIAKGKLKLDDFKQKIKSILKKVAVPVQVFIAISNGYYRKPKMGMWEYLTAHKNHGVSIALEKCFYVGDAAGRPELGSGPTKRKKDHSAADRYFAANIGISFYTPEEHFLGKKAEEWIKPEFEPMQLNYDIELLDPATAKIPSDNCELIVMVGLPGSGKSHFVNHHLNPVGYTVASADKLGGTQACVKLCDKALNAKKSCVVDNTNVDADARKKFVELAKKHGVPCRCFVMNISLGQVKHNLAYRELTDSAHSKINEMVLNMMKKKYKAPILNEGFTEIVKVNIKPIFPNTKSEKFYKLYLTEK